MSSCYDNNSNCNFPRNDNLFLACETQLNNTFYIADFGIVGKRQ